MDRLQAGADCCRRNAGRLRDPGLKPAHSRCKHGCGSAVHFCAPDRHALLTCNLFGLMNSGIDQCAGLSIILQSMETKP
ncbi:hypothetical protein BOSE125_130679 [Bosea sp. 125]|nr:hypothetical protein BOSE125_130679 [Bosea sp. 125]